MKLDLVHKLNSLLNRKQKLQTMGLVVLMVIGAFLNVFSVGMIIPVVNIVMDEEAFVSTEIAQMIMRILGIEDPVKLCLLVMFALVLAFVAKNLFLFFQTKALYAFVYTNQFRTSERMMKNYIRRDYEFFLNADTSQIQRSITSDVNNLYAMILSILQLLSDAFIFLFLTVFCMTQDFLMTMLLAIVMLALLLIIKMILKPILKRAGQENQDFYSQLFKKISEAVLGIKEVKVTGKEKAFVDEYMASGRGYVSAVQKYSLYNNIPKLFIETISVMCLIGYMMILLVSGVPSADRISILAAFAAAALQLLPCVNRLNNSINNISYFEPFLNSVYNTLQNDQELDLTEDIVFHSEAVQKTDAKHEVEITDLTYRYPGTERNIFEHASMTIPIGKAVGVVGSSGAGKSTVIDILLGLLKPQTGQIKVDGVDVKENYLGWLKNIGYIPQMIFMLDDTIRRNIAFGVPADEVSEERIWEVLKEAQLDEFVKTLPEGLDTKIGERGIRLSGGQRQRIGIARALYEDPEILVLDEATSALDNDTEKAIMDSINRFQGRKTLLIIAHRLQTIEKCDMVYRVENGTITRER